MSFVHLHLHTEYSLLDGLNRVRPLMQKVKDSGMDAVAITDHGVLYGVTEFWLGAKEFGVKPIIGCEIYLAPERHTMKKPVNGISYYHLLLLAKNKIGYQNLCKIVSLANTEGFYRKPRIDAETLAKYSEGLICTSACLAGPLARHLRRGEMEKYEFWMQYLQATFGDDFYLEVQRNGFANTDQWEDKLALGRSADEIETIKDQMVVNTRLREESASRGIKLITTTDAHFLDKEDSNSQETLFAIKDGKLLTDPKRRAGYLDTYVKTPQEMHDHFTDIPEILQTTLEVNDKIEEYSLGHTRVQPKYIPAPKEKYAGAETKLREEAFAGAERYYGKVTPELKERLDYELDVIHSKGYDDYFLVVSDIIRWARSQGIVVGVRGSAAGSVVAYCTDIINIEPISWELYFERFLNPERPSPPDIDMDFQDDRRDEVIAYVEQKYGKENVAAICAIGRMKTKAAIRDVGRVMAIDLKTTDKLSKMVHVLFGKVKPIEKMMKDDVEFAAIINSDPQLLKLKDTVAKIEGMARHISTHACGYLITPEPVTNYLAVQLETGSKDSDKVITQQEGVWIEELGLMKFDFLGLRNLTIIKNTLDLVEKYHGVKLTTKEIPLNDKKTFQLFGRGETIGVFQFESPPMQKYLRDLQPETLEDLCFMVSAYRPGPMKYIPDYIDCRHDRKKPEFLIPELVPIIGKTYGFAIYQEQVIKIAVDIAGYSMGGADMLRRAMGKKKIDIMKKEEVIFKKGVQERGHTEDIATKLWEYLLPFADYGFNKAHGASYALIAYWCAYLKANYPIEFMAGLMHSDISDSDRIAIDMAEARKLGFMILPPDINKSEMYFSIEGGNKIRFGLGAVKNVGLHLVEALCAERDASGPFRNLDELVTRLLDHKLNKKAIECLIKVGALDNFGSRNQLILILPQAYDQAAKLQKSLAIGQVDMFGFVSEQTGTDASQVTPLPQVNDVDTTQKITWEKELVGSYITAHPLDKYLPMLSGGNIHSLSEIEVGADGAPVTLKVGQKHKFLIVINSQRILLTKKDNKPMAVLIIEDQLRQSEAVVFPSQFANLREKIVLNKPIVLEAQLSDRDDKLSLIVDQIYNADDVEHEQVLHIDLTRERDRERLEAVKKAVGLAKGKSDDNKLVIVYGEPNQPKQLVTFVRPTRELLSIVSPYLRS